MAGGFPEWRYDPRIHQHAAGTCSGLTARKGRIMFQMAPGSDEAAANGLYVGEWRNLSANYIKLYFSAHNEITLAYYDLAASARSGTWDCTSSLAHDGTVYEVKIEYNRTFMKLYVDNDLKITVSYDVDFGTAAPDYFTLGTDIDGSNTYTSTTFTLPNMKIYDFQDGSDKAG